MKIDKIIERMLTNYPDLSQNSNWGERGLFYNPSNTFSKGAYVLTFKEKDGENDSASNLNRGNIYRLNLKISKKTYLSLFSYIPARPLAGNIISTGHDFTNFNQLMPHPIYGWMTWICVLNPTLTTIESMEKHGLFEEAYQAAFINIQRRLKNKRSNDA